MFHHFDGETDMSEIVWFVQRISPIPTKRDRMISTIPSTPFLLSVPQSGYKRQPGGYYKRSLPPLEFNYTEARVDERCRKIDR